MKHPLFLFRLFIKTRLYLSLHTWKVWGGWHSRILKHMDSGACGLGSHSDPSSKSLLQVVEPPTSAGTTALGHSCSMRDSSNFDPRLLIHRPVWDFVSGQRLSYPVLPSFPSFIDITLVSWSGALPCSLPLLLPPSSFTGVSPNKPYAHVISPWYSSPPPPRMQIDTGLNPGSFIYNLKVWLWANSFYFFYFIYLFF